MEKVALVDIDGVVADDRHREQFAVAREWADYFQEDRMLMDSVWREGRDLVQRLISEGWTIRFLTGRREDRREVTEKWLVKEQFEHPVSMRPMGLHVRLADFKATFMVDLLLDEPGLQVVLFDDDPEVIRTVQKVVGAGYAVHCTWHQKPKAMVREARF